MEVFENGITIECRNPTKPEVAKFRVFGGIYKYCVIGTAYGFIHTIGGDVRVWDTYSGAYKAAKRYIGL